MKGRCGLSFVHRRRKGQKWQSRSRRLIRSRRDHRPSRRDRNRGDSESCAVPLRWQKVPVKRLLKPVAALASAGHPLFAPCCVRRSSAYARSNRSRFVGRTTKAAMTRKATIH